MAPPLRPRLRKLAVGLLPLKLMESASEKVRDIRAAGGQISAEMARALPDSKGGEEPKDLQRYQTDMYEFFTTTIGESVLLYSADQWVRLQLMLETAGPVAVGTRAELVPVLSGKGRLLGTNIPYEVYLPKGARFYYAAENVNRVAMTVEPLPWMEQLALEIRRVGGAVFGSAKAIVAALGGGGGELPPAPLSSLTKPTKLQRLTPMGKPGKTL